jgi:PhnB protein
MKNRPSLSVKNGLEAIKLYEKMFDAKLVMREKFTPEIGKEFGIPEDYDYGNSTMHAELDFSDNMVYLADDFMGSEAEGPRRVEILLDLDSKEQIEKFYNNAQELGCEIQMELEKQFWGAYFASSKDPFGVGWQLNFQQEEE